MVISTRTETAPQLVRIGLAPALGSHAASTQKPRRSQWPCCASSDATGADHFFAWQRAGDAAPYLALFLVGTRFGDGDGSKLRQYVFQSMLRISSMRDLNRECLAWSGIRAVLNAERAIGLIKSPGAFQSALDASYTAWATKGPAEAAPGVDVRLDASNYTARCDMCDEMCSMRYPGPAATGSPAAHRAPGTDGVHPPRRAAVDRTRSRPGYRHPRHAFGRGSGLAPAAVSNRPGGASRPTGSLDFPADRDQRPKSSHRTGGAKP